MSFLKKRYIFLLLIIFAIFMSISYFFFYIVDETQQAVIKEFSRIIRVEKKPGLHVKLPWRNVVYYDSRLLSFDAEPSEYMTKDKKKIILDNYAIWKIESPDIFDRSLKTIEIAKARMQGVIFSEFRKEVASYDLIEVIKDKDKMIDNILKNSNNKLNEFGIKIFDVRIKKSDLPKENFSSIVNKMKAERNAMAAKYRAEGRQLATQIVSYTDKKRDSLISTATLTAAKIKAYTDSIAYAIYIDSYKKSPQFYSFYRELLALSKSLDTNKTLIISSKSPIFKYISSMK